MGTGERAIHNPFADDGGDKSGKPAVPAPPAAPPGKKGGGKAVLFSVLGAVLLAGGAAAWYFLFRKDLGDSIVLPYIAHQPPRVDPHVPGQSDLSDKLDELLFDGLFNVAATPSGIAYEDGLGELIGIDGKQVVSVRLRPGRRWHSSFTVRMEKAKVASLTEKESVKFAAEDLRFSLRRISALGSVSPDYILVSQAVKDFDFSGPDQNHEIRFQFRGDRMWTEADIKEVLSFKVLPATSGMNETQYSTGTGPYLQAGEFESSIFYHRNPDLKANVTRVLLKPFIDNSTYTTELRNRNINVLPGTPFGAESPVLGDGKKYFHKSSIGTTFFALLYNVQRLNRDQRHALRALIDRKKVVDRFFKLGTPQQRNIANYKGAGNNHADYVNYSVFPTTSYYVEENVVNPLKEFPAADLSVLPDTVRIYTNINQGFKEELSEIAGILNDPSLFGGKVKVNSASD
jgi:Bacterial extracellular solute-binding proteins, family 5 Middle